jgi:hypothetical protein
MYYLFPLADPEEVGVSEEGGIPLLSENFDKKGKYHAF